MNYETDMMPISVQILQSLLYNAEKDITRIKIDLEFDDERNYQSFMHQMQPQSGDELQISDSNSEEGDEESSSKKENDKKQQNSQVMLVEDLSRLQLSIILKENYKKQIEEIARKNQVKILIVPEKIKYFGKNQQQISEAKCQVHEIKTNIIVNTLQKYGREVFQSSFYQSVLENCHIHMGKLAQIYYYWRDESQTNRVTVEQTIKSIFLQKYHLFIPLLDRYQNLRRRFNSKYIDALIEMNAKLFNQFLQNDLNDDKSNNHKVELNKFGTEIIIHIQVEDQKQMFDHQIKKFYKNIVQFFIHYKYGENQQIQNIEEIKKILTDKGIIWHHHKDLIVISLVTASFNKSNDSTIVIGPNKVNGLDERQKQFIVNIGEIFEVNRQCSIECFSEEDPNEGRLEEKQNAFQEKITSQYKKYDGIWMISPKTLKTETFVQIIESLILKPKVGLNRKKNSSKSADENILDNTINNNTKKIDDTSSIMNYQQSELHDDNQQIHREMTLKKQSVSNILDQLKQYDALTHYNFYIQDDQGDKKYHEKYHQIEKQKAGRSEQLNDKLYLVTKHRYKCYPVHVPERMKIQMPVCDDIVTVFVPDQHKKDMNEKQYINVFLMVYSNYKYLGKNGWLINVRKSVILQKDQKYQVAKGTFEIIKFVKYLGK